MSNILLKMQGISKSFPGVKALDDVSLEVRPGTVHALMGENGAGKSTLMKCLFGVYEKDAGTIFLDGKEVSFSSPREALEQGVAMVHQELNQVMARSVAENIFLGRFPARFGVTNRKEAEERSAEILKELDLSVDPRTRMEDLSVSIRQMIEIARAVSFRAKILVLDEPTSSLNEEEVEHLFRVIEKLKESGCGIIYISHKMEEILRIADDVTVMRDGKYIGTKPARELTIPKIISMMVGRDLAQMFPEKKNKPSDVLLSVEHLTGVYPPRVEDVSFTVRRGEILGIAGLMGSRRTELLESIFGIRQKTGTITLHGREVENTSPKDAIREGFALLTEERRKTGLFPEHDLVFNSTSAGFSRYSRRGILNKKSMEEDTDWVMENLNVRAPHKGARIRNLSGGNQQKVILGRWLLTSPEILLLDEPTRGIDVGAKFEIYQLILSLAEKGKAVLMVSSEMPELLGLCDRILVMSNGRVGGIVEAKDTSQEEILALSSKYM